MEVNGWKVTLLYSSENFNGFLFYQEGEKLLFLGSQHEKDTPLWETSIHTANKTNNKQLFIRMKRLEIV